MVVLFHGPKNHRVTLQQKESLSHVYRRGSFGSPVPTSDLRDPGWFLGGFPKIPMGSQCIQKSSTKQIQWIRRCDLPWRKTASSHLKIGRNCPKRKQSFVFQPSSYPGATRKSSNYPFSVLRGELFVSGTKFAWAQKSWVFLPSCDPYEFWLTKSISYLPLYTPKKTQLPPGFPSTSPPRTHRCRYPKSRCPHDL